MNKPDFFIIGAPKCGTTTLYHWLQGHEGIFKPESKEPHYFAQNLSDRYCRFRTEEEYLKIFSGKSSEQICGEASVLYCFFPDSIKKILEFNPKAKFIYMVRNPIAMAISYHGQLLVNLEENVKDFEKAWALQSDRKNNKNIPTTAQDPYLLQYKEICALGNHMQKILDIVPENQRLFVVLEDLATNPQKIYKNILEFLGVKDDGRTGFSKSNEAAGIQFRFLEKLRSNQSLPVKFLKSLVKIFLPKDMLDNINRTQRKKPSLSWDFQRELLNAFEKDIEIIEKTLNRNLSHWREVR